jgi:hypothetical protein
MQGQRYGQSSGAAAKGIKIWGVPETKVKTNIFLYANNFLKIN